LVRVRTKSGL